MSTDGRPRGAQSEAESDRWFGGAAGIVLRSLVGSTVIVMLYFWLPLTSVLTGRAVLELVAGLTGLALLLGLQIRTILHSPFPVARAIEALAISVPLFLVLFSAAYFLMGQADPEGWSEPLSRLDAAYFAMTVFATVGFGDITPVSDLTRAVTTGQMLGDIVLVGLIARVIVGAVKEGRRRQRAGLPQ